MKTTNPPVDDPLRNRSADERLEPGTVIEDRRNHVRGVILDHACQYAHPKADPVFVYLVRWEDGQVHSITEFALTGGHDYEVVEG